MIDKPPKGWQDYLCTYRHNDKQYSLKVRAENWTDAEERLKAISWGTVDGVLHDEIPATNPRGWFVPILCWLRRTDREKQQEG